MTDNVVEIGSRLPQVDPELSDTAKTFMAEVLNGRVSSFVAVYVSVDGTIGRCYFTATQADKLAMEHVVDFEALEELLKHLIL